MTVRADWAQVIHGVNGILCGKGRERREVMDVNEASANRTIDIGHRDTTDTA